LTEFHFRGYLEDGDYAVIGQLINLSKLSVISSLYATDEQLMHLKSLRNLEHLHFDCSGPDCDITTEGLIRFFEHPAENASNYFPYRLKYLSFFECYNFHADVAKALVKRPMVLTSEVGGVGRATFLIHLKFTDPLYFVCLFASSVLQLSTARIPERQRKSPYPRGRLNNTHQRNLRFIDISRMHEEEGDFNEMDELQFDVVRNLSDEDVPQLQFLQSHYNKFDQEIFWKLNMKRPNLMITTRRDYFINWDIRDGKPFLNDDFKGDMNHLLNDLNECDGFCCMGMPYVWFAW
uniref:F-box/LRR-repeat protein n=1 Tax=Anisakis simplex TaxID=6269 RepID=A0A0M3J0P4_ANISI